MNIASLANCQLGNFFSISLSFLSYRSASIQAISFFHSIHEIPFFVFLRQLYNLSFIHSPFFVALMRLNESLCLSSPSIRLSALSASFFPSLFLVFLGKIVFVMIGIIGVIIGHRHYMQINQPSTSPSQTSKIGQQNRDDASFRLLPRA